jgi:imidazole glycerol-phosphate synthase subunit HisH
MTIGIINYGMGNLGSLKNAFDFLNYKNEIVEDYKKVKRYDALILPGVGAFPKAMNMIKKKNFLNEIKNHTLIKKKKILGICLGMQILLSSSEEIDYTNGLDFIPGEVKLLNLKNYSVPHVGWSQLKYNSNSLLFKKIDKRGFYYFDHSYYWYSNLMKKNIIAEISYEKKIAAVISKGNIFGVQFHPEKSQLPGLKLLENFVKI